MINDIRGWCGEKTTQFGLWLRLDGNTYKRFHNVIAQSHNGSTQIDHVIISPFGIFVVETKNYSGLIYGSANNKFWTQVLPGEKNKFQNPLHQNYKHTKTLSEQLCIDHGKIRSIVYFVGSAELKTSLPPNVLTSGSALAKYVRQFNEIVFTNTELERLVNMLTDIQNTQISSREHRSDLKRRYDSNNICPKCGGDLVIRTTKHGPKVGNNFLGCSNFPKCKYTKAQSVQPIRC